MNERVRVLLSGKLYSKRSTRCHSNSFSFSLYALPLSSEIEFSGSHFGPVIAKTRYTPFT